MMKKISYALLAGVAMTGMVMAEAAAPSATGFYMGLSAGGANTNVKTAIRNSMALDSYMSSMTDLSHNGDNDPLQTATGDLGGIPGDGNTSSFATLAFEHLHDAGKLNIIGGAFIGYGHQIGKGFVSFECNFGLDRAKVVPADSSSDETPYAKKWKMAVERKMYYAFSVRGGFFATPSTLVYARAGLEGGKWKATNDLSSMTAYETKQSRYTSNAFNNTMSVRMTARDKYKVTNKQTINLLVGLGTDMFVTQNFFVRVEGSHLFGPSIKVTQYVEGYPVGGSALETSYKISQTRFNIGFGYKF